MSPIGRVFIVLNLVLSGVFLGYAGFYLKQADSWQGKHKEDTTKLEAQVSDLDATAKKLQTELNTTKGERDRLQTTTVQLRNAVAAKEDQIKDLNSRFTTLQTSVQGLQADYGTLAAASEQQNQRIAELSTLYLEAKDQASQAIAARDRMNEELESERSTRKTSEESNAQLKDRIAEFQEEVRDYKLWQDAAMVAVPNLAEILAGTLPPVNGEVFNVNRGLETVVLSLQSGDVDKVSKGWIFQIHDGRKYKGQVSVIHVDPDAKTATARILAEDSSIAAGDRAATRL